MNTVVFTLCNPDKSYPLRCGIDGYCDGVMFPSVQNYVIPQMNFLSYYLLETVTIRNVQERIKIEIVVKLEKKMSLTFTKCTVSFWRGAN
jgi:hypothetical protein